jgi:hypothetical protein
MTKRKERRDIPLRRNLLLLFPLVSNNDKEKKKDKENHPVQKEIS